MTESELVKKFCNFLENNLYQVYTEVSNMGQSIDIVAIEISNMLNNIEIYWALEVKLSDWQTAIKQCKAHTLVCDYCAIILGKEPSKKAIKSIKEKGYGLIIYRNEKFKSLLLPKKNDWWKPQREEFIKKLNDLQNDKSMRIKKATLKDSKFVLKLFNDYDTRKNSFNIKPIKEEEHSQWFQKALIDPNIEIYIAWIEGHRIGKCQIEHTPSGLMLSWVIHPEERYQGYGKQMMKQIMRNREGIFYAYIKKSNIASQKIAETLGMKEDGYKEDFIFYKLKAGG